MQALDILDSPLQWETERQNRIHQDAIELRRKQARIDVTHREMPAEHQQLPDPHANAMRAVQTAHLASTDAASLRGEWVDKVFRIPRMRSALIPLDDAKEGAEWSKPFALRKADIEPLASFFSGYKQSRLFMPGLAESHIDEEDGLAEAKLDFAVRALLDLKQVGARVILDPPVQIDAQIEFHDLEEELRDCRDHVRARSLIKVAQSVHEKQLAQAVGRGLEMGNALHDALMGDGHINLIRAWERRHGRKPTVQELHQMLTTGKVTANRRSIPVSTGKAARAPVDIVRKEAPVPPWAEAAVPSVKPKESVLQCPAIDTPVVVQDAVEPSQSNDAPTPVVPNRTRQVLMYVLHAAASTAALIAYAWYF
ncbi:hypothetical protein D3871_10830 [Noviherbaspirillum saxi]|uniref:Uncharacterized protein n=2 Tax=Noviherbaspirillum saxi TaxID=2320863 RepID=A0A3A3GDH3_9BURK|nr:hypothetical protein D3871_10830 [Noviherbaspirillum saxi]